MDMPVDSIINVTLELVCFSVSVSLLVGILVSKMFKTKLARILLAMLIANCAVLLCDAVAWGFARRTEAFVHPLLVGANFFVYAIGCLHPVLISAYIVSYLSYRAPGVSKKILPATVVLSAGMLALAVVTPFTGLLYTIGANNVYALGPLALAVPLYSLCVMAMNIAAVLRHKKSLGPGDTGILLLFLLIPSAAILLEVFLSDLMLTYLAGTVAFVVLYVSLQVQQEMRMLEKENALKTSIMLSQIQPHFLFNSLLAIRALCRRDPAGAEAALDDFSHYLRGNMDSLSNEGPIPFERELRHVNAYLALEKRRFQDKLQVVTDIGATSFLLPPLTLQPIVENAVRHGVTAREEGGTVTITSAERPGCWEITVADDGVGFAQNAPPNGDAQRHIGIENVRSRLAGQCGGTLEIESRPGGGTRVTITLPK